jgi:acyl-CoA thioesterase-1
MKRLLAVVLAAAAGLASACGGSNAPATSAFGNTGQSSGSAAPAASAGASSAAADSANGGADTFKISFLGDSLTAGLGLLTDQSYPSDIGRLFTESGYNEVEIVNAGVSGDTTAGGLRRLDDATAGVRILVVALGGNDALRGLSPAQTRENLDKIIKGAQAKSVQVVLVGMLAPPNLGPDYRDAFSKAFTDLAREYKKTMMYVPFLLEGVAGNPALNQDDGIHPTAEGAKVIADHLYPILRNLVDAMQ